MSNPVQISWESTLPPSSVIKEEIKAWMPELHDKLYELQRIFYADGRHSLLVVVQGLDASGKNSVMRRVFTWVNPFGCRVYGFGVPTKEEAAHDFLWRIHKKCPADGMIHIFNRSHYEDILVPTVEKTLPRSVIRKRYRQINDFETLLTESGTVILKFFLHISYDEQKERLQERIDEPKSHWKHNDEDRNTREKWDDYHEVYEKIFAKTSTKNAPWYIIPADKKRYAAHLIAKRVIDTLEWLDLQRPWLESENYGEHASS